MIPLFILAAAPLMVEPRPSPLCVCSHPRDRHQHLRRDSDCGSCGTRICDAYRPAGWRATMREVLSLMWAPGTGPAGDFAPAVIETSHELAEPGDVTWLDRQSRDEDDGDPAVFNLEDQRDDLSEHPAWSWLYGKEEA